MVSFGDEGHAREAYSTELFLLEQHLRFCSATAQRSRVDIGALPCAALSLFFRKKLPAALIGVKDSHEFCLLLIVILCAEERALSLLCGRPLTLQRLFNCAWVHLVISDARQSVSVACAL